MLQVKIGRNLVNFGLVVVDMQNGFVSNVGSYDRLGMNKRYNDYPVGS